MCLYRYTAILCINEHLRMSFFLLLTTVYGVVNICHYIAIHVHERESIIVFLSISHSRMICPNLGYISQTALEKKKKDMKALKVSHVRMDCLRRSTFPLFFTAGT